MKRTFFASLVIASVALEQGFSQHLSNPPSQGLERNGSAGTVTATSGMLSTPADLSFTDITLSSGTGGPTGSGQTGGHAAIWSDVNNDGLPDLYMTMLFDQPMPDLFFRNTGGNQFASEAASRGIDDFDGGSHGATLADLDNDGDYDLINGTTFSSPGVSAANNIFLNDGNGFFVDITSSTGIPARDWPTRAVVAFDMDNDGDLDIIGVTNFDGSNDPAGEHNELYRNDGNLHFTAIDSGDFYTAPAGQGATDTDFDGDGDIDLFAGNRTGDVNILRNDGSGNFTLVPPASLGIIDLAGDGISTADIDNDDDLDLLLTNGNSGYLYRNLDNTSFEFIRSFNGTDGYMGGFADVDNDGDLDLVFSGASHCYLNDGSGIYTEGPSIPVNGITDPRAVAFADIDNDGDLDFAFACKKSRNWLVRNNFDGGNWLKIQLVSPGGQAGAFGAKTRIYPAGQVGGELLGLRESKSNTGYLGQDDPVLHFGLGTHTAVDVVVHFLDGSVESQTNVAANQTITVDPPGQSEPQPPVITSLNPASGAIGSVVTVIGHDLSNASEVSFNGISADFSIASDHELTATVPDNAASGPVRVTTALGSAVSPVDFTVVVPSARTVFNPTDDTFIRSRYPDKNYGDNVELRAREKSINDRIITFLRFDLTQLPAAPVGAILRLLVTDGSDGNSLFAAGNVEAVTGFPWTEKSVTWNTAPELFGEPLSSSGASAAGGTILFDATAAIAGPGIYSLAIVSTSENTSKFSSKEGAFAPELILEFEEGASPGPVITSFTPVTGSVGTEVTISGRYLGDASAVTFAGSGAVFEVDSDSSLRATVPINAETGPVVITTPGGVVQSTDNFEVLPPPAPEIHGFFPESGPAGTDVTIAGLNFTGATAVTFAGRQASFTFAAPNMLLTTAPAGAETGRIAVTTPGGTVTSDTDFSVDPPGGNTIFTFSPTHDTFVWSSRPDRIYGLSEELRIRKTSEIQRAYFKFEVAGISNVITAKLRLHVIDGSPDAGAVFTASNALQGGPEWTEDAVNWINAPELLGDALGSVGSADAGQTIEYDVTTAITGNGIFSFAIENNSSDVFKVSSKEEVADPELVIEFGANLARAIGDPEGEEELRALSRLPGSFTLHPNYPNPFNIETTISYSLPEAGDVSLRVFNVRGQVVRTLVNQFQSAGVQQVRWNGRDAFGQEVSSGAYLIVLHAAENKTSRRVTLQK